MGNRVFASFAVGGDELNGIGTRSVIGKNRILQQAGILCCAGNTKIPFPIIYKPIIGACSIGKAYGLANTIGGS